MTIKLSRAEHLLWIVPIIYGLVANYTATTAETMTFLSGTYVILSFMDIVLIFLILLTPSYLMHLILRNYEKRDFFIAWLHVILSVSAIVFILLIFSYNLPINISWRYRPGILPALQRWDYRNAIIIASFKVFVIVQMAFLGYCGVTLFRHRFMKSSLSETDSFDEEETFLEEPEGAVRQMIA
jgi:hypothetical protein